MDEKGTASAADRYTITEELGKGGNGTVYKAFDSTLKRNVAIKFLHTDDSEETKRFILEAQAQAQLDHEHIGKIFDVGLLNARPYIAMQLIDGRTLAQLAAELNLEEKLLIVQKIALALHSAHGMGLIHRDVKPRNILIERTADEKIKPFILDFGLVKDQSGPAMTRSGVILGTPLYMAPEQALGRYDWQDRRTDVYSLGAVLYELLTGVPPFDAETELKVILKLASEDPTPIRTLAPQIPRDLETITMKCLEKQPQNRYHSAKALAEDLERYRMGEPIRATAPSWSYVLQKKIRKHRSILVLSSIFIVLLAILFGMNIRNRYRAARISELAQQFGQELEQTESFLRTAYSLPRHDIRKERELTAERMKKIETLMNQLGEIATGPGQYALGRGNMALRNFDAAYQHLINAWNSGYRNSDLAFLLGKVMGELYHSARLEAQRISPLEMRQQHMKGLERTYLNPILNFLGTSPQSNNPAQALLPALLAYYKQNYTLALETAQKVRKQAPWLRDPFVLEGDTYIELARSETEQGNWKAAIKYLKNAENAFVKATDMSRSDPAMYLRQAVRWLTEIQLYSQMGKPYDHPASRGLEIIEEALETDPEIPEAYIYQAHIQRAKAEMLARQGQDGYPDLKRAYQSIEKAVTFAPGQWAPHQVYGEICITQAIHFDFKHGHDPRPVLLKARDHFQQVLSVEKPTHFRQMGQSSQYSGMMGTWRGLGLVYSLLGEYEMQNGLNPLKSYREARRYFQKVIDDNPKVAIMHYNLGMLHTRQAQYLLSRNQDPQNQFEQGISSCIRAAEINPNLFQAHNVIGASLVELGLYQMKWGQSPQNAFDRALKSLKTAQEINPDYIMTRNNLGYCYLAMARFEYAQNHSPHLLLEKAEKYLSGKELHTIFEANNNLCRIWLMKGIMLLEKGKTPMKELQMALRYLHSGLAVNPRHPMLAVSRAQIEITRARWLHRQGAPFQEKLQEIIPDLEALSVENPFHPELLRTLAECHIRLAAFRGDASEDMNISLQKGREYLSRSSGIDPRAPENMILEALSQKTQAEHSKKEIRTGLHKQIRELLIQLLEKHPYFHRELLLDFRGLIPGKKPEVLL